MTMEKKIKWYIWVDLKKWDKNYGGKYLGDQIQKLIKKYEQYTLFKVEIKKNWRDLEYQNLLNFLERLKNKFEIFIDKKLIFYNKETIYFWCS
jgi:hypothetical protein